MDAIVLSGGGSKGSYQIGVWKALRKLHIKYDIVTGTSVGALNGALMTQKSYYKAIRLWKSMNMKTLFGDEAIESENNLKVLKMYKDNFLKNGGMDVKDLEDVINKNINNKKFFKSKINYGLITYNLSKKKPLKLEKKDIPNDKLSDYLMASASCYPAFKKKEIDETKFIDGGIYDNLPINLALDLGADKIISVDLKAPGIKQTPYKKVPTIKISPNNELTNFLNFYETGAKRNMLFGYNDTMKVFGKYIGKKYTFKNNTIKKNIKKHKETCEYTVKNIISSKTLIKTFKGLLKINDELTDKAIEKLCLTTMENIGQLFEIDETKIYSNRKFNKKIKKSLKKCLKENNYNNKQALVINLYTELKTKNYRKLRKEILLNSKEFLQAIYLYTIDEV